jgi:hypothetical protein
LRRRDVWRTATSENDGFQQGIASQAVGPMHADAGAFPGSEESRKVCFSPGIGPHAAHLIMSAWANGNGCFDGIEPRKLHRQLSNLREALKNPGAAQVPEIEQDTSVDAAPFLTAEQKRDIFYNNAARFLRLNKDGK